VRFWCRNGISGSARRDLGWFERGDRVTATVRFKGSPSTKVQMFLGDIGGAGRQDNAVWRTVPGTGQWRSLSLTLPVVLSGHLRLCLSSLAESRAETGATLLLDSLVVKAMGGNRHGGPDRVVYQTTFEQGMEDWLLPGAGFDRFGPETATTVNGDSAARIWLQAGGCSSLSRPVRRITRNDRVWACAWVKGPRGAKARLHLDGAGEARPGAPDADPFLPFQDLTGDWQLLTASRQFGLSGGCSVHLYGSAGPGAPVRPWMLCGDAAVWSWRRGVLLQERFEHGLAAWTSGGQPNELVQASAVDPEEPGPVQDTPAAPGQASDPAPPLPPFPDPDPDPAPPLPDF
jgi:hypothetical protein